VALNEGQDPSVLAKGKVDVGSSLAPFVIIYDISGHVVNGSGYLNGSVPTVPLGVLTAANSKPYNAVTWQPEGGVRIAAVSVATHHYYVLSGRSLKEVELNEQRTFQDSLLGGIAVIVVLGMTGAVVVGLKKF
jgi:hypothetical protein